MAYIQETVENNQKTRPNSGFTLGILPPKLYGNNHLLFENEDKDIMSLIEKFNVFHEENVRNIQQCLKEAAKGVRYKVFKAGDYICDSSSGSIVMVLSGQLGVAQERSQQENAQEVFWRKQTAKLRNTIKEATSKEDKIKAEVDLEKAEKILRFYYNVRVDFALSQHISVNDKVCKFKQTSTLNPGASIGMHAQFNPEGGYKLVALSYCQILVLTGNLVKTIFGDDDAIALSIQQIFRKKLDCFAEIEVNQGQLGFYFKKELKSGDRVETTSTSQCLIILKGAIEISSVGEMIPLEILEAGSVLMSEQLNTSSRERSPQKSILKGSLSYLEEPEVTNFTNNKNNNTLSNLGLELQGIAVLDTILYVISIDQLKMLYGREVLTELTERTQNIMDGYKIKIYGSSPKHSPRHSPKHMSLSQTLSRMGSSFSLNHTTNSPLKPIRKELKFQMNQVKSEEDTDGVSLPAAADQFFRFNSTDINNQTELKNRQNSERNIIDFGKVSSSEWIKRVDTLDDGQEVERFQIISKNQQDSNLNNDLDKEKSSLIKLYRVDSAENEGRKPHDVFSVNAKTRAAKLIRRGMSNHTFLDQPQQISQRNINSMISNTLSDEEAEATIGMAGVSVLKKVSSLQNSPIEQRKGIGTQRVNASQDMLSKTITSTSVSQSKDSLNSRIIGNHNFKFLDNYYCRNTANSITQQFNQQQDVSQIKYNQSQNESTINLTNNSPSIIINYTYSSQNDPKSKNTSVITSKINQNQSKLPQNSVSAFQSKTKDNLVAYKPSFSQDKTFFPLNGSKQIEPAQSRRNSTHLYSQPGLLINNQQNTNTSSTFVNKNTLFDINNNNNKNKSNINTDLQNQNSLFNETNQNNNNNLNNFQKKILSRPFTRLRTHGSVMELSNNTTNSSYKPLKTQQNQPQQREISSFANQIFNKNDSISQQASQKEQNFMTLVAKQRNSQGSIIESPLKKLKENVKDMSPILKKRYSTQGQDISFNNNEQLIKKRDSQDKSRSSIQYILSNKISRSQTDHNQDTSPLKKARHLKES